MDVMQAIKERQSIRAYKTTPVDDNTLNTILEAGRLAPSWGNTQTWRFIVVKDPAVKSQLADTCLRAGNRGFESMRNAPVVIAVSAQMNTAGVRDGQLVTDKGGYWFMFDAGIAMQNMMLAAKSFGLGTCCLGLFDAKKAEKILDVPVGYCMVAMTPLGYPDEKPVPRGRKDMSEILFREKFGRK